MAWRAGVWLCAAALVVLALVAAVGRAIALSTGAEPFAFLYLSFPSDVLEDVRAVDLWFAAHSVLTWTHIVTGSLVLILVPLQFVGRLRDRFVRLHRSMGRIALLAAIPAGVSGLLLQARSPYGGLWALSAVVLAGALFLGSAVRAYEAIRRGDRVAHREWVIRLFAVGLGVGAVRLVALPLVLLTGLRPLELIGAAFWLGFSLPVVGAEWWIRRTRTRANAGKRRQVLMIDAA